jgi:hypothetical protein
MIPTWGTPNGVGQGKTHIVHQREVLTSFAGLFKLLDISLHSSAACFFLPTRKILSKDLAASVFYSQRPGNMYRTGIE